MSGFASYPRISPFLWFNNNAEEAVAFYLSIFKNSKRLEETYNNEANTNAPARVLTIGFELDGQKFTAINGGPVFKFNEAVSLLVRCDDQADVDFYYAKLTEGGSEIQCGWVKDKFGLVWQVVPANIAALIQSPKAMAAMMTMKKLDIAALELAAKS